MRPEVKVGQVWKFDGSCNDPLQLVTDVDNDPVYPVRLLDCDEDGVELPNSIYGRWELDMRRMTYVRTVGEEPEMETRFGRLLV